jgi:hypothetical protein
LAEAVLTRPNTESGRSSKRLADAADALTQQQDRVRELEEQLKQAGKKGARGSAAKATKVDEARLAAVVSKAVKSAVAKLPQGNKTPKVAVPIQVIKDIKGAAAAGASEACKAVARECHLLVEAAAGANSSAAAPHQVAAERQAIHDREDVHRLQFAKFVEGQQAMSERYFMAVVAPTKQQRSKSRSRSRPRHRERRRHRRRRSRSRSRSRSPKRRRRTVNRHFETDSDY